MQEYPEVLQNLFRDRRTRRYDRTYLDIGVPVGTSELIQIQDVSETGVPGGTSDLIQFQEYP